MAGIAGAIVVVTQLWLVASGNFAWLNWLTILLGCSAIDAPSLAALLPIPHQPALTEAPRWFAALVIVFAALTLMLSYWPVRNMISRRQRMNMSFNPFHLINTYGAFGSIGRTRREVVIQGTDEPAITERTAWKEYEFKGKPGAVRRLPRQWAPYHLRLDWLMWFAAISPQYANPWLHTIHVAALAERCGDAASAARTIPSRMTRRGTCERSCTDTASLRWPNCGAITPGGIAHWKASTRRRCRWTRRIS